jgi:hypothetical protein
METSIKLNSPAGSPGVEAGGDEVLIQLCPAVPRLVDWLAFSLLINQAKQRKPVDPGRSIEMNRSRPFSSPCSRP